MSCVNSMELDKHKIPLHHIPWLKTVSSDLGQWIHASLSLRSMYIMAIPHSKMSLDIALMFVWCMYCIWIQLLLIRHWLLPTLYSIDLYDTALDNKHPREFRLTLIQTYEHKQTYEIEKESYNQEIQWIIDIGRYLIQAS